MARQQSKHRGAVRRHAWMIGAAIAAIALGDATASPVVINSMADLQAVGSFGDYVLGQDLDASGVAFGPLGAFHGTFDGQGHTISNLTETGVAAGGLFSQITASGVVSNLKLSNVSISGGGPASTVGGITAFNYGTIHDVSVTGNVSGWAVGGIAGYNGTFHPGGPIDTAVIQNAHTQVNLSVIANGNSAAGITSNNNGSVIGSSSSGSATGSGHCSSSFGCIDVALGGVASFNAGLVADSWSKLGISGSNLVAGGLAASNDAGGTVVHSWAAGDLTGNGEVVVLGGLIGLMSSGTVTEAYARGPVSGQAVVVPGSSGFGIDDVGAVFGVLQGGSIDQVYGTGAVSGSASGIGVVINDVGGFAGYAFSATATASYWDMLSTGQLLADGTFFPIASGLTTAQLQSGFYPAGFDPGVWYVKQGYYPQFTPFPDVPEPATIALFGVACLGAVRRKKKAS